MQSGGGEDSPPILYRKFKYPKAAVESLSWCFMIYLFYLWNKFRLLLRRLLPLSNLIINISSLIKSLRFKKQRLLFIICCNKCWRTHTHSDINCDVFLFICLRWFLWFTAQSSCSGLIQVFFSATDFFSILKIKAEKPRLQLLDDITDCTSERFKEELGLDGQNNRKDEFHYDWWTVSLQRADLQRRRLGADTSRCSSRLCCCVIKKKTLLLMRQVAHLPRSCWSSPFPPQALARAYVTA